MSSVSMLNSSLIEKVEVASSSHKFTISLLFVLAKLSLFFKTDDGAGDANTAARTLHAMTLSVGSSFDDFCEDASNCGMSSPCHERLLSSLASEEKSDGML